MKKVLIQVVVGTAVVVLVLIALNKFVPNFTLFPKANQVSEVTKEEGESPDDLLPSSPEIDDTEEMTTISKPNSNIPILEDEEESTIRINDIPKGVVANKAYSLDKRLRAGSLAPVTPMEVIKVHRRSYTNSLFNEVCPSNIKNYHKDFAIYFDILDEKLVESILFIMVEVNNIKYAYKAQKNHNKLVLPNNLKIGRHQITFGYFLKKDAATDKIPYYANNCMITVK